jgi:stress-induced morphogen
MDATVIEQFLRDAFPDGYFQVQDYTGGGDHFQAVVVTTAFEGKSLVQRHKLVYAALGGMLQDRIHALTLKTYTPHQWEQSS